jgi:ATP-dependent helicase/nuclease subunit A
LGKISFTGQQNKVIAARGHDILVSAAAGSGKTAVLVERIVREITEGDEPLDIDRLLVVTFTKAAAAQMKEKLEDAIEERLRSDPDDRHLRRQETLLRSASIETIDSFCASVLRNNFNDIGLDPGYRQADEAEAGLLQRDTVSKFLEKKYAENDPEYLACVEYFCHGLDDKEMEPLLLKLYRQAMSHPWPEDWLRERAEDCRAGSGEELLMQGWLQDMMRQALTALDDSRAEYRHLLHLCEVPGGPYPYADKLEGEIRDLFTEDAELRDIRGAFAQHKDGGTPLTAAQAAALWKRIAAPASYDFGTLPRVTKKAEDVDPGLKTMVSENRRKLRDRLKNTGGGCFDGTPDAAAAKVQTAYAPVRTLLSLVSGFCEAYAQAKRARNVIDFDDLEHLALQILAEKKDGAVVPRRAADMYRAHYREVMVDEYQDSNDVQELLLSVVSGDSEGRYDRFMVGDVKQSIYRFRLARPEIFMEKYSSYAPDDDRHERIDLDRNFRSRGEVIDAVNGLFSRIMRSEVGGVEYDDTCALRQGAAYPEIQGGEGAEGAGDAEDAVTELLIVDKSTPAAGADSGSAASANTASGSTSEYGSTAAGDAGTEEGSGEGGGDAGDGDGEEAGQNPEELNDRRREALAIAQRIHRLVGRFPVKGEDGGLRPARYGDIVVLLRAASSWDSEFRTVFEQQGIPCYVNSRAGYFATEEIREVLQFLRILDNPRQDIPLYGALHGYFGGFSEEELAGVRLSSKASDLYTALVSAASDAPEVPVTDALRKKCADFLASLAKWREKTVGLPISGLLTQIVDSTGYIHYVAALPAGAQRLANLRYLLAMAKDFERTSFTGLFHFLRYIDEMHLREVDFGEANTLEENADVVRIMTIHKSKGLEFPIVFCAGLAKRKNAGDTKGTLICDSELGIGADTCDTVLRSTCTNIRKEAVAERIARNNAGEELRILYTAMTRAKEKLILTSLSGNYERVCDNISPAAEEAGTAGGKLSVSAILGAGTFLELVTGGLLAAEAGGAPVPVRVETVTLPDMDTARKDEQESLQARKARLSEFAGPCGSPAGPAFRDPELAKQLEARFGFVYPYRDLEGLYTKTTVTELKKASARTFEEDEETERREDGRLLFEEETAAPYLPSFADGGDASGMRRDMTGAQRNGSGVQQNGSGVQQNSPGARKEMPAAGVQRGNAIHKCMEMLDYARFTDPASADAAAFESWRDEKQQSGRFTAGEAALLTAAEILPFLHSGLAGRMARAAAVKKLRREQPFVLGVAADRLDPRFPKDETVLVQGIIDAFFIEDGAIVVLDYKTDRVHDADVLLKRYSVQLDCYAEALERLLGMPVKEKIIYSFALQEEIHAL